MKEIYLISRWTIAIIFIYHGLVPKLLYGHHQEILMNDTLIPFLSEQLALKLSGVLEIVYGALILVWYHSKKVLVPAIAFSIMVSLALLFVLPELYQNAFNPFSINLSLLVLCVINVMSNGKNRSIW